MCLWSKRTLREWSRALRSDRIGFPSEAPRTGEAIPMFVDLVDRGIIRVIDVLVVQKDAEGVVSGIEIRSDWLPFGGAANGRGDPDVRGPRGSGDYPGDRCACGPKGR